MESSHICRLFQVVQMVLHEIEVDFALLATVSSSSGPPMSSARELGIFNDKKRSTGYGAILS